jgi:hypothetical protein
MPGMTRRIVLGIVSVMLAAHGLVGRPGSRGQAVVQAAGTAAAGIHVALDNPLDELRPGETIALDRGELDRIVPGFDVKQAVVVDASGRAVLSQLVDTDGDESPDQLVFQCDFLPGETKAFELRVGQRGSPTRADFLVYGRLVRERHDDFAWENDRIAHRMYGPDLETWKQEPLTSSGVDVWVKRVPRLVINDWYMVDDYHRDQGEGADLYSVGTSRGCGGLGIWANGQLYVSRNFTASRVLANGPIRLVFELDYAPWDAGGGRVSETKRVVLDAGSQFDSFESTFKGAQGPLQVGIGIAKHAGGSLRVAEGSEWMETWEPLQDGKSGHLGCAVVLSPGSQAAAESTETDHLLVTSVDESMPLRYYAGCGWDRGGHIADLAAWSQAVQDLSRRLAAPIRVSLAPTVGTQP